MTARIPYGRQHIDQSDIDAVTQVLKGDYLTGGAAVEAFETSLCTITKSKNAIVCSSGTAALHLAAMAADLGSGDIAIIPAITFLATANAVRMTGADVVFCDVDPLTGLVTPENVEAALKLCAPGAVKAVLPVHLNGQLADCSAISEVVQGNGVILIEDACHALGTTYDDAKGIGHVGDCRHSHMSVFSFHPVKTIAMGEGGAITTNNSDLANRMQRLRNHGMTRDAADFKNTELAFDDHSNPNPWYYEQHELGYNYRASDMHCALGNSQLKKLSQFAEKRRRLVSVYEEHLAPLAPMVRPIRKLPGMDPVWHIFPVLIDFAALSIERSALMQTLAQAGISTQVHYIPVPWQPYYQESNKSRSFPGAQAYYEKTLTLPLHVNLNDDDILYIVGKLKSALGLSYG